MTAGYLKEPATKQTSQYWNMCYEMTDSHPQRQKVNSKNKHFTHQCVMDNKLSSGICGKLLSLGRSSSELEKPPADGTTRRMPGVCTVDEAVNVAALHEGIELYLCCIVQPVREQDVLQQLLLQCHVVPHPASASEDGAHHLAVLPSRSVVLVERDPHGVGATAQRAIHCWTQLN